MGELGQDSGESGGRLGQDSGESGGRLGQDSGESGGRLGQDSGESGGRLGQDSGESGRRLGQDSGDNNGKTVNSTVWHFNIRPCPTLITLPKGWACSQHELSRQLEVLGCLTAKGKQCQCCVTANMQSQARITGAAGHDTTHCPLPLEGLQCGPQARSLYHATRQITTPVQHLQVRTQRKRSLLVFVYSHTLHLQLAL